MSYNTKNYTEQGGDITHINGVLKFGEGAELSNFPGAENFAPKTTNTAADIRTDLNKLITYMKNAGIMKPDEWNVSVLACPSTAAMPTAETAANSGHATFSVSGTKITIALDCKVSELVDANHGETWGTHKWLGFGVRTGLESIVGVKFTDDTGASATLGSDDAGEATTLELSAGDFVLYIKAEDAAYLAGGKSFTLRADNHASEKFTMKIVEATS